MPLIPFPAILPLAAADSTRLVTFFAYWVSWKNLIAVLLVLLGTVLLLFGKLSRRRRIVLMASAFFLFGILGALPLGAVAAAMGLHPSPVCMIEKPILFAAAGRTVPIGFISLFALIALLSISSNKGFCAWVCPVGAVQELLYRLPLPRKFKLPFSVTNLLRVGFLIAFVALAFAFSFSLYEWINAFHLLHFQFSWALILPLFLVLTGILIYRPFCYLFCPVGLFTWAAEQFSVLRLRVNHDACNDCRLCVKKSPCPTVPAVLDGKRLRPDCHACGECINACPEKALSFKA